jgi:hypothetical protein
LLSRVAWASAMQMKWINPPFAMVPSPLSRHWLRMLNRTVSPWNVKRD